MRFDEEFELDFFVDNEIDRERFKIPPMLIQPHIENAIWHGLMQKKGEKGKVFPSVKLVFQFSFLNVKTQKNYLLRKCTVIPDIDDSNGQVVHLLRLDIRWRAVD